MGKKWGGCVITHKKSTNQKMNRNQPIHTIDCKNKLKNKLRKHNIAFDIWYYPLAFSLAAMFT